LAEAWRALAGRDFVLFGKLTSGLDQGALCALRMPVEDGPVSSEPEAKALAQTMDALRERGLADCFRLDLTIARELDYYTGIVFEAYARGAGNAVIGGGRYDTLLERFGASAPAAGFAIDMDSLVCAMGVQCDA
jgi:ATP phosphoribosyltransferase regulatory subunit